MVLRPPPTEKGGKAPSCLQFTITLDPARASSQRPPYLLRARSEREAIEWTTRLTGAVARARTALAINVRHCLSFFLLWWSCCSSCSSSFPFDTPLLSCVIFVNHVILSHVAVTVPCSTTGDPRGHRQEGDLSLPADRCTAHASKSGGQQIWCGGEGSAVAAAVAYSGRHRKPNTGAVGTLAWPSWRCRSQFAGRVRDCPAY